MLAFTIVGYNLEAIRSLIAKKSEEEESASARRKPRRKRRTGTWTQLSETDRAGSGRAPPLT